MPEHLYRFRPTVLGKYRELENQEIYFSSLDNLNDPMEGFTDLFWFGDQIVWKNLIKHYLLCLDRVCVQFMITGNERTIELDSIPVFETENDLPTHDYKDVYKLIVEEFFAAPPISEYVERLCSRTRPMRRDELCCHLRILHCHALIAIFTVYKRQGIVTDTPTSAAFREFVEKMAVRPEIIEATNALEAEHPTIVDGTERLYAAFNATHLQIGLIAKYNHPASQTNYNVNLMFQEFPDRYVKLIERIVHGDWYMACFAEDYTNSSMWGQYADNHRGVCLKFSAGGNDAQPSLALQTRIGPAGGRASQNSTAVHKYVNHIFHKVAYKNKFAPVDFFRSLGHLRGIALSWWYSDGKGNSSSCVQDVHQNAEEWRQKYWAEFLTSQTIKLEDWAYEKEYRLVLQSSLFDYSVSQARLLKYEFSDLKGMIFGINTPEAEKLAIMRLIEEKCRKENRKEFEFYQAYYAKHTGKIEALPLNLIKFSESRSKQMPKIAILGWGSLLWDASDAEFDGLHDEWKTDGPVLKLEFSRKSASRLNALTLVIDPEHGNNCQVAYSFSSRATADEALADLCAREKTNTGNIGIAFADGSRRRGRDESSIDAISQWAKEHSLDVVIWTDLSGSFGGVAKERFLGAAIDHVQRLPPAGKVI